MCPLSMPQQALDTPAVVTCFLAVPVIKKVRWERGLFMPVTQCGRLSSLETTDRAGDSRVTPSQTALPRSHSALETQVTIINMEQLLSMSKCQSP